ncbi:WD40 repeat domain-containing serine/threonine protein kinase [Nonomuraea turcica]|uniref:WD40 repeat domain-containing serine/threonine protein kinase n=1 Tax=Nonomuraea sp. G32 TaxID=3067274 RepID=UPI00273CAE4E|nr:WD40 repeat domain-containing serine/threonine protein kinase [Nonomuraea sp. G32]MDP4506525.1 WD40 repeat domain-containing serine/threonine protein kinase [Nonomuraea sp. G32]
MAPLAPSDPHRLGRYWLAGRLGQGGQGVVYEAYGDNGERVAVKVPRFDNAQARARLAQESAAAERVASFCTARVIEARVDVPVPYIVSEFVPGPNLRQVVDESGPYRGDRLRRLAIGVATALTAIHRAGIVHRDLKPDNIILGPDGPRVIDFGVAREVGPTTSGPLMGTPAYMPPEVLAGSGATEAADLWAWAMVVLFAAGGSDAIAPGEPMAVVGRVLAFEPDTAGLPDPLGPLVAASLAADPAARPAAKDVLLRLVGEDESESHDLLTWGSTQAGTLRGPAEPDLGAIAEELYGLLTEAERASTPEVFLRMVDGDTLRPVARDELPETEAVDAMLAVFAAAGLVASTGTAYELARPGLLHAWPRLRDWVAGNREGLPVHRRLADAAAEWESHGRRPADLMHGSALDRTLHWAAAERKDLTLARREREYLDAASRQARRQSRRRNLVAAALAVLLVATLGGLGTAEYLRRESNRQRDDARSKELVLRAADLREIQPELARLLSVAAWRLSPELPETRGALYDSVSQPTARISGDASITDAELRSLSHDGRTLVAVVSGKAQIWDVSSWRRLREFSGLGEGLHKVALSPDSRVMAVQGPKGVQLWDVGTGRPLGGWFAAKAEYSEVYARLEFDRTGRLLSVPVGSTSEQLWDVATRRRRTAPSGAALTAISADGRLGFASTGAGERAELWDLRRGVRMRASWLPRSGSVLRARFSEDAQELAIVEEVPGSERPRVRALYLDIGSPWLIEDGEEGQVVDYSLDGRFVAAWTSMREVVLWRGANGQIVLRLELPDLVSEVRLDTKGRALRVLTDSGTVHTIDVAHLFDRSLTDHALDDLRPDPGARVLAVKRAGILNLLDTASGRPLVPAIKTNDTGTVMAFSPDGKRLATTEGTTVLIIETSSGKVTARFRLATKGAATSDQMVFSRDGRTLAVIPSGFDGQMPSEWDDQTPLELLDLEHGSSRVTAISGYGPMEFLPNGGLIMPFPEVRIVDPVKGRPAAPEAAPVADTFAVAADGSRIALSQPDGISLWDGELKTRLGSFPYAPDGDPRILAWSPDKSMIAGFESGARIRLWDVASRRPLGVVFDGLGGDTNGLWLEFSADGRKLVSLTDDGTLRTHDIDEHRVAGTVCERVGRALTAEEWRTYLPEIERFRPCP